MIGKKSGNLLEHTKSLFLLTRKTLSRRLKNALKYVPRCFHFLYNPEILFYFPQSIIMAKVFSVPSQWLTFCNCQLGFCWKWNNKTFIFAVHNYMLSQPRKYGTICYVYMPTLSKCGWGTKLWIQRTPFYVFI